jgi:hypothetical protein
MSRATATAPAWVPIRWLPSKRSAPAQMPLTACDQGEGGVAVAVDVDEIATTATVTSGVRERAMLDEAFTSTTLPRGLGHVYRTSIGSSMSG